MATVSAPLQNQSIHEPPPIRKRRLRKPSACLSHMSFEMSPPTNNENVDTSNTNRRRHRRSEIFAFGRPLDHISNAISTTRGQPPPHALHIPLPALSLDINQSQTSSQPFGRSTQRQRRPRRASMPTIIGSVSPPVEKKTIEKTPPTPATPELDLFSSPNAPSATSATKSKKRAGENTVQSSVRKKRRVSMSAPASLRMTGEEQPRSLGDDPEDTKCEEGQTSMKPVSEAMRQLMLGDKKTKKRKKKRRLDTDDNNRPRKRPRYSRPMSDSSDSKSESVSSASSSSSYRPSSSPQMSSTTPPRVKKRATRKKKKPGRAKSEKKTRQKPRETKKKKKKEIATSRTAKPTKATKAKKQSTLLLAKLLRNHPNVSQMARVGHRVLTDVIRQHRSDSGIKTMDRFLSLISRTEMILQSEESARITQIVKSNQQADEEEGHRRRARRTKPVANVNAKRVRFCCYDLSTVSPPVMGDLNSGRHCEKTVRILVEAAEIGLKLFSTSVSTPKRRPVVLHFEAALRKYIEDMVPEQSPVRRGAARFLLQQFESVSAGRMAYPFEETLALMLSSLVRFYVKTIFNASEFVKGLKDVRVPDWYRRFGTSSPSGDGGPTEFLSYHASELSIQLRDSGRIEDELLGSIASQMTMEEKFAEDGLWSKAFRQSACLSLDIEDDPAVFWSEMHTVVKKHPRMDQLCGNSANVKSMTGFESYMKSRWMDLRRILQIVQRLKCGPLMFYLPLLQFDRFLKHVHERHVGQKKV